MPDRLSTTNAGWSTAAVQALIAGLGEGVVIIDAEGRVTMHNDAAAVLLGVAPGQLAGQLLRAPGWVFVDADDTALTGSAHPLAAPANGSGPFVCRALGVKRDGVFVRWLHLNVRPLTDSPVENDGGAGRSWAVVIEQAGDPRSNRSVDAIGRDGQHPSGDRSVDVLFGQRVIGMVHILPDGQILRANDVFADLVGMPAEDLVGVRMPSLVDKTDVVLQQQALQRMMTEGADHHACVCRFFRADGTGREAAVGVTAIREADGRCRSLLCQVVDTARLNHAEEDLSGRALFDPLTRLINRAVLIDLLGDQLRVRSNPLAVVALNLDRFKAVNDSLGQAGGDDILVRIATRLRDTLRPGDVAARVNGDDFVLLCGNIDTVDHARAVTQRILDAVAEPLTVGGLTIKVTASAGVALVASASGLSGDQVITMASQALNHAKDHGRARFKIYDNQMRAANADRLFIETSLRAAMDQDRLSVAYQPVVNLTTGRTVGAEALVRWHDPVNGFIPPMDFLPVAEETGLIVPVGEFVLGQAVAAAAEWRDQTGDPVYVSVNLSPYELNRPGIAEHVDAVLEAARLPSTALRFEITETVLVDADEQVRRNMADLHDLGVVIGIDDFGTGYASMSYVKNLPVDFLKIDRSFVAGIGTSREDMAIVRATLELAQALNLITVAEGIETPEQFELLRSLGCHAGQGFVIGRPAEATAMVRRLIG